MESVNKKLSLKTLHVIGVFSGLAAGAWLGAAEAPVQLVTLKISPYVISTIMVLGVFVTQWSIPTILKGTKYVFHDLKSLPHILLWAIIAGALWAVANTLTVFAIKDIGLAVAFPIWNSNCVIGLLWGCLLFKELKGAERKQWYKVGGGILAIVLATLILGFVSSETSASKEAAVKGVLAALGAGLLWGTQYIPYRKAYISGMNPLSFVTIFTFGELITVLVLSIIFLGGIEPLKQHIVAAGPVIFWFFLGGFCWVIGDIFQQFACKYIGIGRGIPLSNTNQLWGLAWAALVYHNFAGHATITIVLTIVGCLIMLLGAAFISSAEASEEEHTHWLSAVRRECKLYNLDEAHVVAAAKGEDPISKKNIGHRWWDFLIIAIVIGIFVMFGMEAQIPPIFMDYFWMIIVILATLLIALISGFLLYKHTKFS